MSPYPLIASADMSKTTDKLEVSVDAPSINDSNKSTPTVQDKLYIDNTDQIVLKATLDGAIESYFTGIAKVEPVNTHSNFILAAGFLSILITAVVQFNFAPKLKIVLIAVFFLFQGLMNVYKWFVQKNEVFVGRTKEGVFSVSTTLPAYEIDYTITMTRGKNTITKPTQVSSFFTANGLFLKDHFHGVLAEAFDSLNTRKNQ